MPVGDAIEVAESIEAKGDVEMEDTNDRAARPDDSDVDADADEDVDADGDIDMDAEGEPDDDAEQVQQDQSSVDLLQLIKDTSEYLCQYTIQVDGE